MRYADSIMDQEPKVPLTKEESYEIGRQAALTGEGLQLPSVCDLRFASWDQITEHVKGYQSVSWVETPSGKELIAKCHPTR